MRRETPHERSVVICDGYQLRFLPRWQAHCCEGATADPRIQRSHPAERLRKMVWQNFRQAIWNGNMAQNATTQSVVQVRPRALVNCIQILTSVEATRSCVAIIVSEVWRSAAPASSVSAHANSAREVEAEIVCASLLPSPPAPLGNSIRACCSAPLAIPRARQLPKTSHQRQQGHKQ